MHIQEIRAKGLTYPSYPEACNPYPGPSTSYSGYEDSAAPIWAPRATKKSVAQPRGDEGYGPDTWDDMDMLVTHEG